MACSIWSIERYGRITSKPEVVPGQKSACRKRAFVEGRLLAHLREARLWPAICAGPVMYYAARSAPLLVPECPQGINHASSSCWNPAGKRRDTQQNRRYTNENRKIDHALGNRVNGNYERK